MGLISALVFTILLALIQAKVSFIAIGDWGSPGRMQRSVASSSGDWGSNNDADFVITTGDNFYENGVSSTTDKQWDNTWNRVYTKSGIRKTWYATLGNHDHRTHDGDDQVKAHGKRYDNLRWYMLKKYYTFSKKPEGTGVIQFIALDTDDRYSSTQLKWFQQQLQESKARWIIVYGHHGTYSSGSHGGSGTMESKYRPLMEKYKVALYFQGHDHNMEHVYNPSSRIVDYVTSGSAAKLRSQASRELKYLTGKRLYTKYFKTNAFAGVTISGDRATVEFIDGRGKRFYSFTKTNPRIGFSIGK